MTERKFTPPTEFPAEYVDSRGNRLVVLGGSNNENYPLIGFDHKGYARAWTEDGAIFGDLSSIADLHDIPKRITTWHNVYTDWISPGVKYRSGDSLHRLCVYRIERDEDGGNPEIFVEEV